jgi:transcriptional regulator with XRE-family HTH domain
MAKRITTPGSARLLGQRIADLRLKSGKSQGKLSMETGVERSLVSKIESGHFKTYNESVHKICTRLGLNPLDPEDEIHLDTVFQRLSALTSKAPHLLKAINGVLDALEYVDRTRS